MHCYWLCRNKDFFFRQQAPGVSLSFILRLASNGSLLWPFFSLLLNLPSLACDRADMSTQPIIYKQQDFSFFIFC
jgi:hypothetical protein